MQFIVQYSRLKEIPSEIPKHWRVAKDTKYIEVLEFRYTTSLTLRTPVVVIAYGGDDGYVINHLCADLKRVFSAEQYETFSRILWGDEFWQWYIKQDTVLLWRTKL